MVKNLFSKHGRTDFRPAMYGEHPFSYLDLSARPEANNIRKFLQEAFKRYPDDESAELKNRIQGAKITQSNSAFFELILHETLCKLGFTVTVHPMIKSGDKRPDFLVTSNNGASLYIEAICTSELGGERSGLESQKNKLYDEINAQFNEQSASLSISVIKQSKKDFSSKDLFHNIRANLNTLQTQEVTHIKWQWISVDKDWEIELQLHKTEQVSKQFISCIYPNIARRIDVPSAVQKAFMKKSTRYGELEYPYILAINIDTLVLEDTDEMEALFGKEQFIFTKDAVKFAGRQKNGAWNGPDGPKNTRVSGVWLFHELNAWRLNKRHVLYLNPFCSKPINENFYCSLPLAQIVRGKLERRPGQRIFELLGINWDWLKI